MGLNVLDLFCGCGGLSCGFVQAGFNVILGIDNDKAALNTFQKNHKKTVDDIKKIVDKIKEEYNKCSELLLNLLQTNND